MKIVCTNIDELLAAHDEAAPRRVEEDYVNAGAIVDAQGRHHAPCDGYMVSLPSGAEAGPYRAGEYLPECNDDYGEWRYDMARRADDRDVTLVTLAGETYDEIMRATPKQIRAMRDVARSQIDAACQAPAIGEVGERVKINDAILAARVNIARDDYYTVMHIFIAGGQHKIMYWQTIGEYPVREYHVGERYSMSATISRVEQRDDVWQSTIRRPRLRS